MRRHGVRLAVGLLVATIGAAGPGRAAEPGPIEPSSVVARSDGVHVLVWDAARKGADVWAADPDGSHARRLYHQDRGYIANLTLSRDGRFVALNPLSHQPVGHLVVAATDGTGQAVDLVHGRRGVVDVGVLDWSPDGRRLAFEGFVDEPSAGLFYPSYLFTVRADGTGLRRRGPLGDGRGNGSVYGAMTWTEDGIVYPDDDRLLLIRGDRRRTLVRRVTDAHPTADHQWIFFRRVHSNGALQELWRVRPDGTDLERVATSDDGVGDLLRTAPDADGTHVLALRRNERNTGYDLISFTTVAPHVIAPVPVRGYVSGVTWR